MVLIGITGGIGSGKTCIAKVLEKMNYPVFYSDFEAKKLYSSNHELKKKLKHIVGSEVYKDGVFQKDFLAKRIFSNPNLKEQISGLVHPLVREEFRKWANKQTTELVFNEAAILFETGSNQHFDAIILVVAPIEIRIDRVMQRDNLTREKVLERMEHQWPDNEKIKRSPFIIQNDGRPILNQIEKIVLEIERLSSNEN